MDSRTPFKVIMLGIKFLVGKLPQAFRKNLRSNAWLYQLYSRSIHKSGLFYGVPSPAKLQKLYEKTIARQSLQIQQISREYNGQKANAFVCLSDDTQANKLTITSLSGNGYVNKIVLLGTQKQQSELLNTEDGSLKGDLVSFQVWQKNVDTKPLFVLRGGDIPHPLAIPALLNDLPEQNVLRYCDCDRLDDNNQRCNAEFYPDWDPDLQLSTGYVKTGIVITGQQIIDDFVSFMSHNCHYWAVSLWLVNVYLKPCVVDILHLPITLLHQSKLIDVPWYDVLNSSAYLLEQPFTISKGNNPSVVKPLWHGEATPLVSLIIPTKNAKELVKTCIESILDKTTYSNYEILLIDNNSDDPDALAYFETLNNLTPKIKVLAFPYPFNYSAINNFAAGHAKGEIIGLINNDVEVIAPDWLSYMVGHVSRQDIGCVGAKLLYPDTRIQHAGVVMGYGGGAGHAFKCFPKEQPGYLNRLIATHSYSAVTAACLLVKKADFEAVNGLNESDLSVAFNDVDLCLKVRALGRRNLYCAEAELYHHESVSRGNDDTPEKRRRFEKELTYLQNTWPNIIARDPAYNPNLTLRHENFSIKEP